MKLFFALEEPAVNQQSLAARLHEPVIVPVAPRKVRIDITDWQSAVDPGTSNQA